MKGKWPDATTHVLSAAWHAAGEQTRTPMGPAVLPEHCEITAAMQDRVGRDGQHYAVRFHLRLPAAWNERFFFEGGGGTEGELGGAIGSVGPDAPPAVSQGYAVVSQDSGHDNATNSVAEHGGAVAFGLDPIARANYGGASLKAVADAAKAAVREYYGRALQRSYFFGCSKGGQEGMAFAQRFPEEFDGIVAGAPGFSLPRAAVAEVWDTQSFESLVPAEKRTSDPRALAGTFSDAQFGKVREAILAACDAQDGLEDGITANFEACRWPQVKRELDKQQCSRGQSTGCLSEVQIDVLGRVLGGPKNSHGQSLYSDWPLDAGVGSVGWRAWKIGGGAMPSINAAMGGPALAEIFTTPPTTVRADLSSALTFAEQFDFDRDAAKISATSADFPRSAWDEIAARSPHLEAFRAHGGRMIVTQGASDPVFSLNDTLAWFREVDRIEHGQAARFVRVFPVPGMAHCGGGPATDQFDSFGALVAWVEKAQVPGQIVAKAGHASPWPGRTRPLCPYPKVARYSGSGSIEEASSFQCN
ncbi:MAG TPA: tannase/feruloyl esterase family alpha/beta hydrolase [Terriglobia bacterium]|nr:tannase/feruloyl esterase family alpha/beta hydrolase [Terriglobia bacterium]